MLQYKTIVLALLQQRPQMYQRLRKAHQLFMMLNYYSRLLEHHHEIWMEYLWRTKPSSHRHITQKALGIATKNLDAHFPHESPTGESGVSLEEAVTFINSHTPPD